MLGRPPSVRSTRATRSTSSWSFENSRRWSSPPPSLWFSPWNYLLIGFGAWQTTTTEKSFKNSFWCQALLTQSTHTTSICIHHTFFDLALEFSIQILWHSYCIFDYGNKYVIPMSSEFKYVCSCYNNDLVVMWGNSSTANRGGFLGLVFVIVDSS